MGLKIAMVTTWHVKCGIASYSENLANALAQQGVDVYIVRLPRFGAKTPEILQTVVDSIPVDKLDLIHVQHEYGLYQNLEEKFYSGLKMLGKPIVTTMHAVGNWGTDTIVSRFSQKVIVHNEFCARRFGHPCVIIPHGAKPEKSVPAEEAKRDLGIDPRVPIVGYCGFISSYKGLEVLIEAMAKVPDAALLIGGGWHTGQGTQYIIGLKQRSLKLLPGRCQWLGWVPDERLPTVYGSMSCVVYPSRFATESGALIMALSYGKATIASNLPPFREKEKKGALVTFRDIKDLRRKIRRVLKDDDFRHKLEEGARRYAYENRWGLIAERHISLYRDVVRLPMAKVTGFHALNTREN